MASANMLSVEWRRSSYSTNGGNCVEIGDGIADTVPVRDSKNPTGPILLASHTSWTAFLALAKATTV
ncbi:DUF397 domain-containing protein [Streptomyces sp. 35G-GA-8]|uniref:DUF397 domain-containing protein n=1 Tax=Streptomyces sp. 35G-GA-8 TaxID=2939434 RepID=UPI00201EF7AB|nr:DUF397 domain-containing protein [Streptomyces sp. 35G-GA-8]MCL7376188.1 DUF397 domain-containing protein [Streptomyces sp. 35G-GA-8]